MVEFLHVLAARDEARALEALDKWTHLREWPRFWTFNGGLTYYSTSRFEDACRKWPWLALRMLDAGLEAKASENNGCVALYAACRASSHMEVRVELVHRLLRDGVDVNGLGPMNQNKQGRTPLAGVLDGYGGEEALPILQALLGAPGIQLEIQNWVWNCEVSVPQLADAYARDRHGRWAIPYLQEALASRKARVETEAEGVA